MPHSIDAESNKVVNAIIYIGSGALVIGVPHADCASSECFRHRKFGNDVKRSACAAASAQCRIRSTNDLYLFNREHFARLRRRIANPVDKSRSEEHTSELQSLMRISYAVFCLKKKKQNTRKIKISNPTRQKCNIKQKH